MFFNNADMRQNGDMGYGENINIDIDNFNTNTGFNPNNFDMGNNGPMMMGPMQDPIVEPGKERVIQRNIIHEVKHVCPVNTKIINNHIFRHTYEPRYTCCEENVCTNVQCGSCSCFN